MAEEKTYLELSQEGGGAHKFYEVIVDGCELKVRYGRIGDKGQAQLKTFPTAEKAQAEAAKKLKSKTKKGYAEAVMGGRAKRAVTRRATTSKKSKSNQSPILWRFATGASTFGIFVDEASVWAGTQAGRAFRLDHDGQVRNQFKLPDGVKCIVADDDWLYAGCDDGNVYDLSSKSPMVAYQIKDDVDIYWIDINDGVLGVADANGNVTIVNHEDESQWSKKSQGDRGWMVRCDEIGVWHGHSAGVTMYDWEDGEEIWHEKTSGSVLFGWQEESTVYAATSNDVVQQFNKKGEKGKTYRCDDTVYSCAAAEDGKYVFAGDSSSSIYCFGEDGERLWKLATGCGSALSMQYFRDRLYVVTSDGILACVDASSAAIQAAQEGKVPKAKSIKAPAEAEAARVTDAVQTVSDAGEGIIVECYKEGSKLRVRVITEGYEGWNVQFPKNLREEGARYVVNELRESSRGGFYRAYGEIQKLE
ncbi:MAG: WGR domain-containing protein [Deltaproteobacteria bacterium]|nr:WGR domain-containing protein [Deltaproteobacteria bacterium]